MRDRLFKLLGVEAGEESMVSMLLAQSVFLGIFFGAFDISAHSLFLSIFDEKMMARGYVLSGLAGILLTSAYTGLQTRMHFRNFSIVNLIFVTASTLLLWFLLLISPAKWVVFLVFIMLGPLNIMAMLGFWGTAGRLFTLRQGKRLFGLIDSGMIIGIIISCYAIPVLLSFNFSSHNILIISAAAVLVGSVIQILIGSRFEFKSTDEPTTAESVKKRSVTEMIRSDSYIRVMAVFIALSVMAAFFVQYSFMAVTREQYPAEDDMARFLGLFTGSMMIFTLLIKLLVFSYLIRNYGLRTCLAISPFLVAAFTIIAVIIGMLLGFTPAAGGFMLFFMLLALSRLFSKSLKDSIESPSFKVIYQTIDEKIRYEVQSAMDGTVNEIAALTSGLVLSGLGILSFIKLIHFSWVLVGLTLIWIYFAVKLYSEYRKSIRKALESGKKDEPVQQLYKEKNLLTSRFSCDQEFYRNYTDLISGDFSSIGTSSDKWYVDKIIDYAGYNTDLCLIPALKKIASEDNFDDGTRHKALNTAQDIEQLYASVSQRSAKLGDAIRTLAGSKQPQTTQVLRLLRDNDIKSRKTAINMIGKFKLNDMLPEVCESLAVSELETTSANVLRRFGEDASQQIIKSHLLSSGNTKTGIITLRLLAENSGKENDEFFFTRLWSNSRELKEIALQSLVNRNYSVKDEDRDRLHQMISEIIGIMVWNISARISIHRHGDKSLLEPLNYEINRWNRFLFNLLAIAYDPGSVNKIRQNLESETVESVNFALEMIDIVIDESVKPKLVPLVDTISDEEKVKTLYQFYPGDIPDYRDLVDSIINRDYNLLGIWIRACTIRGISKVDNDNLKESLKALLFSPEEILREESAQLMNRLMNDEYKTTSLRLSDVIKKQLDSITGDRTVSGILLYEKTRFLSEIFSGLPEESLIPLAGSLRYTDKITGDDLAEPGGLIIWPVDSGKPGGDAKIIYDTSGEKKTNMTFGNNEHWYLLPLKKIAEYDFYYPGRSIEVLKYIETIEK